METKVIKIEDLQKAASAIKEAADVLARGGLVGFPTETVYGLAANTDSRHGPERLSSVKKRSEEKPYTLHIGEKSILGRYVPQLSLLNRQFLKKAWPGPLTVVFTLNQNQIDLIRENLPDYRINALYHEGSIGIRMPDHEVAQSLLRAVDAPVIASSANISETSAPVSAEDVLEQLAGRIDLILDSGPTKYQKASTIVRLTGDELEILREGVLDAGAVKRMRQVNILFVCTGNSCRSPMAEGFCQRELAEKLGCSVDQLAEKGYKIISAGILAGCGAPATPEAVQACQEASVDISGHRTQLTTAELVYEADYIFAMDASHLHAVNNLAPYRSAQTVLLSKEGNIADPIGMPIGTYRKCARLIARSVQERLKEIF